MLAILLWISTGSVWCQEPAPDANAPAAQEKAKRGAAEAKAKDANPADSAPFNLADAPPFDVLYFKGQRAPMRIEALKRPFQMAQLRRGDILSVKPLRVDRAGSATVGIKTDDIMRIEFFEDLLEREGSRAMERRDFAAAFDLFARLVHFDPQRAGAKDKLLNVFFTQAQAALEQNPPDYDAAIALCVQLRAEDRKASTGVQSLLRKACLGRAQQALDANDFATARDQLDLFFQNYPHDAEATRFQQDKLVSKAKELVGEARKAMEGSLDDQRRAAGLLLNARHIWPNTPEIDRLIERAKRNYPVLNVAIFDKPGTFEPVGAESLSEWQACQLIFDWLFEPDESGGQFFRGPMLERWTQQDLGLKHEFALRRDQRWSDGKPVTAWDIESSLQMQLDPRANNFDPERARFIGDMRTRGPFSISVDLLRPHPRPLTLFAVPVLPRHIVLEPPERGSSFSQSPVGTGPFQVGSPDAPQQTKFVANPAFRGAPEGQPFIKEINFHEYVKSGAAVRDMDEGKTQLMTRLDPLEVIRFSKLTGQFEVRSYLSNSVYWLAINHQRPPFEDLRVRRAMLMAIDRQAILTQYFQAGAGGLAHRVITGPFPTHSPAYDPKVIVAEKDEPLAKQLIEEVKKESKLPTRTITLKYPLGDAAVEKAASQIRKDLQKIGLDVKTEAKIESDLHSEVIDQQDFDLVYWRFDHRNVLYNIAPLFDPDQRMPGGTNFMGYQNPELVKLFSYLRQEQRPLELWEIQREIHRFVHREVVFVPLWQLDNYIAHTSKLMYRSTQNDSTVSSARQLPIHPLYLFRKTEGWYLEP